MKYGYPLTTDNIPAIIKIMPIDRVLIICQVLSKNFTHIFQFTHCNSQWSWTYPHFIIEKTDVSRDEISGPRSSNKAKLSKSMCGSGSDSTLSYFSWNCMAVRPA